MRANAVRDVRFSARDMHTGAHNSDSQRAGPGAGTGHSPRIAALRKKFQCRHGDRLSSGPEMRQMRFEAPSVSLLKRVKVASARYVLSNSMRCRASCFFDRFDSGFSNVFVHAKGKGLG